MATSPSDAWPGGLLRVLMTRGRKLDHGNPNPGNIGADFSVLGMQLWDDVRRVDGRAEARRAAVILGALEPASDVDVFELGSVPGLTVASIDFGRAGPSGYGATKGPGVVSLRDDDGALVARVDQQLGARLAAVPLPGGHSYFVELTHPDAKPGGNDFYVAFVRLSGGDSVKGPEVDDGTNDTPAGAQLAGDPIYATTPAGDVDWYDIGWVDAGERIRIHCLSRRAGSGVADLTVSLFRDPALPPLQSEQESPTQELRWTDDPMQVASMAPPMAKESGQHYLEVKSTSSIEGGPTSYHYLCWLSIQKP